MSSWTADTHLELVAQCRARPPAAEDELRGRFPACTDDEWAAAYKRAYRASTDVGVPLYIRRMRRAQQPEEDRGAVHKDWRYNCHLCIRCDGFVHYDCFVERGALAGLCKKHGGTGGDPACGTCTDTPSATQCQFHSAF